MKMGIEKHDPYIVFAYDERNSYSMVLDNMRANFLLKWIEGGKTARFRSVILKENTIIPTIFTEILLIPNYYNRLQIDSNPRIEDRLQQSAQLFQPAAPHAKVTQVAREHRMQEVASFKSEQGLRRIQGYVVNVDPYAPGKKGYKCPVDKKQMQLEICGCGTETDVFVDIKITIWDGAEDVLQLKVDAKNANAFLNGHDWEEMKSLLINPKSKADFIVEGKSVVKTFLIKK